ncbi:hypothetical protein [Aquimarina celericrescens]|uniref:AAA+ ATPase domain-containing protein n=1 Tax=Aquimarina celericrescens TaxID=1964542 RepID=A0ABW5AX66_9FLAO|nr:hypothetical protein [Aquimarina celericrescens]
MNYTDNISTNIIRDNSKEIDYIVTPNSKEIFDRIFLHSYGANKSFNLIGNYGTGKSTFLWALEKNLNKEKIFFSDLEGKNDIKDYEIIKLIGDSISFSDALCKELNIKKKVDNSTIINEIEKRRLKALKNNRGLIIVVDEFGKFLEFASKNKTLEELFLLQQISEWANNDSNETYFIITLHQNFSDYGKNLSSRDKLEWDKIKGRFVDLLFNEPVEQLIYFASNKLKEFVIPKRLNPRFNSLIELIKDSKLVSHNTTINENLSEALYPLDWLSANILVNSLQRYGQNERSLFSFLNDNTKYSIRKLEKDFYTVSDVFDYLTNTLPTEINSLDNPHRAQWYSTFKALERAELHFDNDYGLVSEVIKTVGLTNIFSKAGGLFDIEFIKEYFKLIRNIEVGSILETLEKTGIIRFYRYSNKINFLEGTDIDLEQELINVSKEINPNFSVANEILSLIDFPIMLVKRYSFETGTPRFFEFKISTNIDDVSEAEGAIDGYINLIFDDVKSSKIKEKSKETYSNLFVHYKNSNKIKKEVFTIKKFDLLIEKHQSDKNALKLIDEERLYCIRQLEKLVLDELFDNDVNTWIHLGKKIDIQNKHRLYEQLTDICYTIYPKTPTFINELINKEYLSAPINAARKYLFRNILNNESSKFLGFPDDKFPPEKAIYISLLKETGIHRLNKNLGYYELSAPDKGSVLSELWKECQIFIKNSISNKKNIRDLYDILSKAPYKLKKGFTEFWIPIFLMATREDYALFHINGNFIPFLTEEVIDLIHKNPSNFQIKSYDISGLKINLLESYKELVQIESDTNKGVQSTFLSIFGNFLRFQRGLNSYALKTNKLSTKAINLRNAIKNAKDPEDALFNQFPNALGFPSISIKDDEDVLKSYTEHIQSAIREIRTAYEQLIDRVEKVILAAFYCESIEFPVYKEEIISKLNSVNSASLANVQNAFYKRIISPLDDKSSWIKSLADVALGKGLEELIDEEESLLIDSIKDLALGLIKASEIQEFNESSHKSKLYSFRFFDESGASKYEKIIVSKTNSKTVLEAKKSIAKSLNNLDIDLRKEILIELLSAELKED